LCSGPYLAMPLLLRGVALTITLQSYYYDCKAKSRRWWR
jgi:hypothetical protein